MAEEVQRPLYSAFPDCRRLALVAVTTFLPVAIREQNDMPIPQVSQWIGFFSYALPRWSLVESSDDSVIIMADYGGLDILVVRFDWRDFIWTPVFVNWLRAKG